MSTEQVSVLLSFGGLCDHVRGSRACLRLLGRDGITRRKIYINAKIGLKSSLLLLSALPMLKGTVDKYQEEKKCVGTWQ